MGDMRGMKRARGDEETSHSRAAEAPVPRLKKPKHSNLEYPPSFWDNLSTIPLSRAALRELDRRNRTNAASWSPRPAQPQQLPQACRDIKEFARRGGPNLLDIRGYAPPDLLPAPIASMVSSSTRSQSRSTRSQSRASRSQSRSTRSQIGKIQSSSKNSKSQSTSKISSRSGPYKPEFEQHLIDYGVYMASLDPEPANLEAICDELRRGRSSLSPGQFTNDAFKTFMNAQMTAKDEATIMNTTIGSICGNDVNISNARDILFTHLEPLTTGEIVKPKPDFFDGAHRHELGEALLADRSLASKIIPSKNAHIPVVPNLFLEVKGPGGSPIVAKRQACYDGANGARAMHALQNHGSKDQTYDGNAYAFSATYIDGMLTLYAHHVQAPVSPTSARPQYHMTQIDSYAISGNRARFIEGAAAFRNLRLLAKRYREAFIRNANAQSLASGSPHDTLPSTEN
ncbi:uncharacterized protein F5Z01DRAFT_230756 [Emericellopsis atlantica]|uniref:DUF7924 domain-containing protein n=1 Tax=Emericellopsis atlantica TaxID=2614577 RepID=A0A9P7ZI16_9HYPO|nr:uncharacterized protein F5Z01DRAFT_230756 [Emericellopsis atlantica]KAG9252484.1 hypothetical protein F5Z01DRAFT_230756 [Emericellopsis atlantica]